MEFKQLEIFTIVVELSSFSLAAKKLFLTQPTVSAHISALEKDLGKHLITRTTKYVEATKDGKLLYDYANSLLKMRQKVYDTFKTDSNVIFIGSSTAPSTTILPEVLTIFRERHPDVTFDIWQSDSKGVIDRILEGSLDIGLTGMSTHYENCVCEPFFEDEIVIITPATPYYKSLKARYSSLQQFLNEPVILRENGSGTFKESQRLFEKLKIDMSELNIIARINNQETVIKMVANGMGISIMSSMAVDNLVQEGKILSFNLHADVNLRSLYIVYKKNRILAKQVIQLIDLIKGFK